MESIKAKNIKQTELMIRLRDAILRVSRYFQVCERKNCIYFIPANVQDNNVSLVYSHTNLYPHNQAAEDPMARHGIIRQNSSDQAEVVLQVKTCR